MIRSYVKLVLLLGAIGPTVLGCLSARGVNPWWLAAAVALYAALLGAAAWRMEQQKRWSGVALSLTVLVLGMLIAYFTHRRFLR